jgi:hypothetical protein
MTRTRRSRRDSAEDPHRRGGPGSVGLGLWQSFLSFLSLLQRCWVVDHDGKQPSGKTKDLYDSAVQKLSAWRAGTQPP